MAERFVLVLAGGRGERFWPWSRPARPKQLLPLAPGGRTLLAATLERARRVVPAEHILVLTARDLVDVTRRECPGVEVTGEPVGRNTAAAIGVAAMAFAARAADPAFAVMPADHVIEDAGTFAADLERAFALAERERVLVTFGIPPREADPNFGYIRSGERLADRVHRVARFTEKPDRERARQWLAEGGYAWNSGIFVWRSAVFLDALRASRPELARGLAPLADVRGEGLEAALDRIYPGIESISVDYAVLESAPNTLVIEAAFDWDDVGSWAAWARRQPHDERGNVVFGAGAVALDCERCVVVAEGGTAAAMGLSDMVVVHVDGATLTCRLDASEQVRRVTEAVRAKGGAT